MWELAKWVAAGCFLLATIILFSPRLAATSTLPWIFFLIGNVIWVADSARLKNIPWTAIGIIFTIIDAIMIYARAIHFEVLDYITPVVSFMESLA